MGWCSYKNRHYGSYHYYPWLPYARLSAQDRRAAHYVQQHVHGLSYYPNDGDWRRLGIFIETCWTFTSILKPSNVLTKGELSNGTCLKNWTFRLGISKRQGFLNLRNFSDYVRFALAANMKTLFVIIVLGWTVTNFYNGFILVWTCLMTQNISICLVYVFTLYALCNKKNKVTPSWLVE